MDKFGAVLMRRATLDDVPTLYCWDEKPHVKQATSNSGEVGFDSEWEHELSDRDDGTEFFIASVNNHPIGALQIINPETERSHYWGAVSPNLRALDIWIGEEEYLGKGHGTDMMRFALNHCFSNKAVTAVLIDPLSNNTRSHKFYKRFGFEFMERRIFDADSDCFVFRLSRAQFAAHFRIKR